MNTTPASLPPALPPRPNSLSTTPSAKTAPLLQAQPAAVADAMDPRYYRSSSPRRHANPARASTGTFADPLYDATPRASGERVVSAHLQPYYTPPTAVTTATTATAAARTGSVKYDSYTGRPRRNTEDRATRPTVNTLAPPTLPLRTPYTNSDRPTSPLAKSFDPRGETYPTLAPPRRGHKKVYSVDTGSHIAHLIAEKDLLDPMRHPDSPAGYSSVSSGGRGYQSNKPPARHTDISDDGYSYTDPASMYRDTEPAWRRPRTGSMERGSRPTSMIVDRSARNSARELGPPPSTRGFDKINSIPRPHGRSSSIDRSRDTPKYDPYSDATPTRTSSTRHHAPAIHQEPRIEPREHRRDPYPDDYDRHGREVENRRHSITDRFEDREIASRGFGIAPVNPSLAHDHHLDRQPMWSPPDVPRPRSEDINSQYFAPDRADARMPEPHVPRERAAAPAYPSTSEDRPREREESRRGAIPIAAGAVAGVAATLGAAVVKSREQKRERAHDRESDRDSSGERERRKQWDERDRRDRYEDRREKTEERREKPEERREKPEERREKPEERREKPEERREKPEDRREKPEDRRGRRPEERRESPPSTPSSAYPVPGAYPSPPGTDRKPIRNAPSLEGSGDERPRHYVTPEAERRNDSVPQEAALDPDEEYRRRIQLETERNGRTVRDPNSDSERERDRRRRKEERSRSRAREDRVTVAQEPESVDRPATEQPSKAVQIVEPTKESPPPIKGILRKPTEKFPEHPTPIREGVAPHKDSLKGKDIPIGARWTRIDRKLVNPEALEQAKERFEERADCVIVLRVLTKEEIQKLADRTKKIRDAREDEYDREHRDRDRRSQRSHRDDEEEDRDRDRRRRYDEDDYSDRDESLRERERERERERDRERDRPRALEPARKREEGKMHDQNFENQREDGTKDSTRKSSPNNDSDHGSRFQKAKSHGGQDGKSRNHTSQLDRTDGGCWHLAGHHRSGSEPEHQRVQCGLSKDASFDRKKKSRFSRVLNWL